VVGGTGVEPVGHHAGVLGHVGLEPAGELLGGQALEEGGDVDGLGRAGVAHAGDEPLDRGPLELVGGLQHPGVAVDRHIQVARVAQGVGDLLDLAQVAAEGAPGERRLEGVHGRAQAARGDPHRVELLDVLAEQGALAVAHHLPPAGEHDPSRGLAEPDARVHPAHLPGLRHR
jgi:hypothetical protein